MKYKYLITIIISLVLSSITHAENSPYERFKVSENEVDNIRISWIHVPKKDLLKRCNEEFKKYGNDPLPKNAKIEACSIDNIGNERNCVIITQDNASFWNVGHEIRHCFQPTNFHDQ